VSALGQANCRGQPGKTGADDVDAPRHHRIA
jgi:hypothetical protein